MEKKITLATVKAFMKRNANNLYIKNNSQFDGMVDMVVPHDNPHFRNVSGKLDISNSHTYGIGAWFVLGGGDWFYKYSNLDYEGISVHNCCGSFVMATKRVN